MYELELSKLVVPYELEEEKRNITISLAELLHIPFNELVDNSEVAQWRTL